MSDTKEELRHQVEEASAALTEKLSALEQEAVQKVSQTTAAVTETVAEIRETAHETVQSVKNAFDVKYQIRKHPFTMMAGAAATGYIAGSILVNQNGNGVSASGRAQGASAAGANHFAMHALIEDGVHQLRNLAIATLVGIVRDIAVESFPNTMERPIANAMDSVAASFGTQPLQRGARAPHATNPGPDYAAAHSRAGQPYSANQHINEGV